jgi:hypothetical protein
MLTFKSAALGVGILFSVISTAEAGAPCRNCFEKVDHPPVYRNVEEKVKIRPAQTVSRIIPAEYGVVYETVVVRPAYTVIREIPAKLGTVAEQVMVSPPRKEWQVTVDANGRQIGCWVQMPAVYAVRHRTVVVTSARFDQETVPAVYETRARRVLISPQQVQKEVIPAQYATQVRTELVQPASSSWQPLRGGRAQPR